MLRVVRIADALSGVDNYWQPRVIGAINDFHVKVARLHESFMWHHHETEDELFLVISGTLQMHYREPDGTESVVAVHPGEFVIVPHGTVDFVHVADQIRPALAGRLPLGRIGLARRRAGRGGGCRVPFPFRASGVRISPIAVNQVFPRLGNLGK